MWEWDWGQDKYHGEHFTLKLRWELKNDQEHIEITVQQTINSPVSSPGKVQNG